MIARELCVYNQNIYKSALQIIKKKKTNHSYFHRVQASVKSQRTLQIYNVKNQTKFIHKIKRKYLYITAKST